MQMYNLPVLSKIDIETFENEIQNTVSTSNYQFLQSVYVKHDDLGIYLLKQNLSDEIIVKLYNILVDIGAIIGKHIPDNQMRKNNVIDVITFCDMVGIWLKGYLRFLKDNNKLKEEDIEIIYAPAYPDIVKMDFNGKLSISENKTIISSGSAISPTNKFGNIITYKVIRHEAASIDAQPFIGRRPKKPKIIEEYYDKTVNRTITEMTFRWDNLVQFDCFAKTETEAQHLLVNFERMMMLYGDDMGVWGLSVPPLHYGWVEDETLIKRINVLNVRSVQFYVRTEEKYVKDHSAIEQINVLSKTINPK